LVYGQFTNTGGVGATYQQIPYVFNAAHTDISHNLPAGINSQSFSSREPFSQDISDYRLHWEFNYSDLPWDMTLTYLGGYDETIFNHQEDLDNLAANFAATFVQRERPHTQNQEIRLASSQDDALTWQTGIYYFNEASSVNSVYNVQSGTALAPGLSFQYPLVNSDSYAAFGQVGYKVTDDIKLSAGVRETYDDKSRDGYEYVLPPLVGLTGSTPLQSILQSGTAHFSKFTWHVGVGLDPDGQHVSLR